MLCKMLTWIFTIFICLEFNSCLLFPMEDCSSDNVDLLMVFDCRDHVEVQLNFTHHLLQHFISTQETRSRFSLATFSRTGIKTILPVTELRNSDQVLSLKNPSQPECFNMLSVPEIFEFTHFGFNGSRRDVTRLAVVLFNPNVSHHATDVELSHQIVQSENKEDGIQRFFIMSSADNRLYPKRDYMYYIKSLVKLKDDKGVILSICSNCRKNMISFTASGVKHNTCYFIGNETSTKTFDEISESCRKIISGSNVLIINSTEEYFFVMSSLVEKMERLKLKEVNIYLGFSNTVIRNIAEVHKNILHIFSFNRKENYMNVCKGCYFLNMIVHSNTEQVEETNILQIFDKTVVYRLNNASNLLLFNVVQICEHEMSPLTQGIMPTKSVMGIHTILNIGLINGQFYRILHNIYQINKRFKGEICNLTIRSDDNYVCSNFLNCNQEPGLETVCNNEMCDGAAMYFSKHQLLPVWFTYIDMRYECQQHQSQPFTNNKSHSLDVSNYRYLNSEVNNANIKNNYSQFLDVSDIHFDEDMFNLNISFISVPCTTTFSSKYNKKPVNQSVTVPKCIYSSNRDSVNLHCKDNLKDCETFQCPELYFKCPNSYCIPLAMVNDNRKDCPDGDDEDAYYHTGNDCKAKIKTLYRNLCVSDLLEKDYLNITYGKYSLYLSSKEPFPLPENSEFFCETLCPQNYTCLSSTIKEKKSDGSYVYRIHSFENTYQLYDNMGTLMLQSRDKSDYFVEKMIEMSIPNCSVSIRKIEFNSWEYSDLLSLDLSHNDIQGTEVLEAISSLTKLRFLNLSFNENIKLTEEFSFPPILINLDLSYTGIQMLSLYNFRSVKHMKYINLSYTKLKAINFPLNFNLHILDLRGTHLNDIEANYFNGLIIEVAMFADDYKLCCPQVTGSNISQSVCHTPLDVVSSCKDLISDLLKRIILWTVGTLAVIGNALVLIYRLIWDRPTIARSYGAFVASLAVADLFMGFYLIVIAIADTYYRDLYVVNDSLWRYSRVCQISGFLATLSNEISTFFICLITLDRYIVMKYPLGEHRISYWGKVCSVTLVWCLGTILALIPTLVPSWEVYSTNALCLGLPLSTRRQSGWQYSITIFLVLNSVLFLCIALGQVAVFRSFFKNKMKISSTSKTSVLARDTTIAKKLALVALSDFLCVFPVGVMGIISLAGYELTLDAYAWSAVLVLPINSALNPVIYTAPAVMQKL